MRNRCIEARLFLSVPALACCFLLAAGFSSFSSAAGANPLEEVVATVEEATAPLQATVETVVPPPPPPPPAPPAASPSPAPVPMPAVEVPPVKVPDAPVKDTLEAANGTVTEAAAAVSSLGEGATGTVEKTAGKAGETVAQTVSPVTAPVEEVLGTLPSARAAGPVANGGSSGATPVQAEGPSTASDSPDLLANAPARFLDPFIHVWPAVALTVEGPLGRLFLDWSRSVLARFEASGTASLRGDLEPLDSSAPATASASDPSDQPAFSWLPSPSRAPFNWAGGDSAFLVLAVLIALATATLTILGLARRELGLPILRRGNRFPWRH